MTTENGNTNTKRLSVPAILAKLITLQQRNSLPDPTRMDAGPSGSAQVDVDSRAALDMWIKAMGCEAQEINETAYSTGDYGYWIYAREWAGSGWWVQVRAIVPDPVPKSPVVIDADDMAVLESKPIVSDEAVDALLAELNGMAADLVAFDHQDALTHASESPIVASVGQDRIHLHDGRVLAWHYGDEQWVREIVLPLQRDGGAR